MDALANEWDTQELTDWGVDINWDEPDQEVVEDEAPEVNESEPAKSELGKVYKLGNHRLMCGDSTDAGSVAILMDGQKADMVFTDPPYGISIVGDNGKVGAENLAKNRVYSKVIADDTTETAEKAYKVLKNYSSKLIIWGGNYFINFLDFSDGWIIWDKRGDINSNNFADGEMAWCSFHTPVRIYKQIWNGMIREGEHENRVHPTQKPVKMLGEILKDFTKDGEIVLDVFGGSGSTLIACEQLDRKCYMMELDPHYCDVIRRRWWKFTHDGDEEGWEEGTPAI
jgi:DNA modification methylase